MNFQIPTLLHLSFKRIPNGVWYPRQPAGMKWNKRLNIKRKYPEPDFKRICVSETIDGCFMAVYPNIHQFFEDAQYDYPHVDFYYYMVDSKRELTEKEVLSPLQLTDKQYVWDAHLTREWSILVPVHMRLKGRVRFHNTANEPNWIETFPFDDNANDLKTVCPPLRYEFLEVIK